MEIQITHTVNVEYLGEFLNSKFINKLAIDEELIRHLPKVTKKLEFTDLNNQGFKMQLNQNGTQTFYHKTRDKRDNLGNTKDYDFYTIKEKYYRAIGRKPEVTLSEFIKTDIITSFYRLKEKTIYDYKQYINTYILPEFGSKALKDITTKDISTLHEKMKDAPYQANRVLGMLNKIFRKARKKKIYNEENPCQYIMKYKETKCDRVLSKSEIKQLQNAMRSFNRKTDDICKNMINFLLYSGVRISELLSLKAEQNHNDVLIWKNTKTGRKILPLVNGIKDLFYNLQKGPMVSEKTLRRYFAKLLEKAKIKNLRIHDLRHTFATYALKSGASLEHVKVVLNHKNISTTSRYCHVDLNDVRITLSKTEQILNA